MAPICGRLEKGPMTASRLIKSIATVGLAIAFCVPAFLFLTGLQTNKDQISQSERRVLEGLPEFSGDARAFTSQMDAYLEDRFGMRMLLIRLARKVRDNLGENPPNVVYGQDGWLYLGALNYRDEFEGQGVWGQDRVDRWVQSLADVNAALSRRNIPFVAFIAVDKARAYPEHLPNDWREGLRRFRTAVYTHRNSGATGLVDAERYVMRAKAAGRKVFFHRDTHWTPDGTFDLAMAILDRIDPEGALPRYAPEPPVLTQTARLLDLDAMAGFETSNEPPAMMIAFPESGPDGLTRLTPEAPDSPHVGQFATIRSDGTNDPDGPRLVIIGDSFADSMLAHFHPSFSEIIRIHHGAHLFDVSLDEVLAYEPDAVLFATAERQAAQKERPFQPLND